MVSVTVVPTGKSVEQVPPKQSIPPLSLVTVMWVFIDSVTDSLKVAATNQSCVIVSAQGEVNPEQPPPQPEK